MGGAGSTGASLAHRRAFRPTHGTHQQARPAAHFSSEGTDQLGGVVGVGPASHSAFENMVGSNTGRYIGEVESQMHLEMHLGSPHTEW